MNTETLKINLAQRILSLNDLPLLEKIKNLLKADDDVIYYTVEGKPITKDEFISEMDEQQEDIKNGTAKFHTTDNVRKIVMNENSLGR
ncbi:hypothetical protein [Kaistella jeonii]|uniref:Uncharacterized protein n=1 Tax=Kaistella jeonii TaxID=266749 RepID=A0A0C1FAD8_9FLAO|nr:hypothetical protein [Kaistella jeonii]KIA88873.1 hypothetical protein OA86_09515 [Kaistella jeonii]SFC12644.1 hypothetical protein SAMN05421876_10726 [Kaistella jeonii]VEI94491.1 Uncharacterised protein [Kaistella jeonii]